MDTSVFSQINWLAVLVAAIAYFMLGALWFSKPLFANAWVKHHQIDMNDPEAKKGVAGIMLLSFVWILFISLCLAVLVERLGLYQAISGLKLGLFTGFGFAFSAISITLLYVKKPFALHLIDGLYHVAGHIIAAIILCLWK